MTSSSLPRRRNALCGTVPILVAATLLAGCASLPSSGPTTTQIKSAAARPSQLPFKLVEVTSAASLPPDLTVPPLEDGVSLLTQPVSASAAATAMTGIAYLMRMEMVLI